MPESVDSLEARGLIKRFGDRTVVREASLNVSQGEVVGLLGPNGAGKTTSFYMIMGLIQADAGHIYLDGEDVTPLPMYQRARLGVGYLPQEASIFRGMTVAENILAVIELVENGKKACEQRLDQLLDDLKITHIRDQQAQSLSGGERRRVEIARALAGRPKFILLDEPFTGIDPLAVSDISELIRFLRDMGLGVLITDHQVRETLQIVDRAYVMFQGEVLFSGTPTEILNNSEVRRVYLGSEFAA